MLLATQRWSRKHFGKAARGIGRNGRGARSKPVAGLHRLAARHDPVDQANRLLRRTPLDLRIPAVEIWRALATVHAPHGFQFHRSGQPSLLELSLDRVPQFFAALFPAVLFRADADGAGPAFGRPWGGRGL